MNGPVVFQMWMVLLFLGTMTGVGRAQVSTARVMRGNIRRDGEMSLLFLSVVVVVLVACAFSTSLLLKLPLCDIVRILLGSLYSYNCFVCLQWYHYCR